jgi:hypothetical protein
MALPATGCNLDADRRLRAASLSVGRVVHVDTDSVLYLDPLERPHTAWMRGSKVIAEDGFCAERGVLFPDEFEFGD